MANTSERVAFVCVPGGFCPPQYFDKAEAGFRKEGYQVATVDLPSVGKRSEGPAGLYDDAEAVRTQVRAFADEGLDVVLVGNSYGGWVITEAAKGISTSERQAEGKEGGLKHMVYLASGFSPDVGLSVSDLLGDAVEVPNEPDGEGYLEPPPPEIAGEQLAPSLSKEERLRYGSMLKPFSNKVNQEKLTYLGFEHVPTTAVITTNDIVVKPDWQFAGYNAAVAKGKAKLRKAELAGDHCCMLSNPRETVRICIEAASL